METRGEGTFRKIDVQPRLALLHVGFTGSKVREGEEGSDEDVASGLRPLVSYYPTGEMLLP